MPIELAAMLPALLGGVMGGVGEAMKEDPKSQAEKLQTEEGFQKPVDEAEFGAAMAQRPRNLTFRNAFRGVNTNPRKVF